MVIYEVYMFELNNIITSYSTGYTVYIYKFCIYRLYFLKLMTSELFTKKFHTRSFTGHFEHF